MKTPLKRSKVQKMLSNSTVVECAASALTFLAGLPEDFLRFLSAAGAEIEDVRTRAEEPEFLGFVLDFILSDDELAQNFCETENWTAEQLAQARAGLPGGDAPHWV